MTGPNPAHMLTYYTEAVPNLLTIAREMDAHLAQRIGSDILHRADAFAVPHLPAAGSADRPFPRRSVPPSSLAASGHHERPTAHPAAELVTDADQFAQRPPPTRLPRRYSPRVRTRILTCPDGILGRYKDGGSLLGRARA
jgi:hypothetical protein